MKKETNFYKKLKKRFALKIVDNMTNLLATLLHENIRKFTKMPKKATSKRNRIPFSRSNPFSKFDYIIVLEPKSRVSQDILNWFWTSAILTIPVFYASFIFAIIVSKPVNVVESFDDISRLPKIEIVFLKGTSFCYKAIHPTIASQSPSLISQISSGRKIIQELSRKEVAFDETLDGVLDGKKLIYGPATMMPKVLSNRFKRKKRCGFYQSRPHYTLMRSMLFNKVLKTEIVAVVNKK